MKKVFVTGATGFLGYHLVKELSSRGIMVYAMHQPGSKNVQRLSELENVVLISCKLECLNKLPDKCREREFDVFYHLAWRGASGEERKNCNIQIDNIKWSSQVVEVAQQMACKKIVVAGTICENQCEAILTKGMYSNSVFYLYAKRSAYEMVKLQCLRYAIPLVWCTFYHPIGKFNKKEQLIANTIWKLLHGKVPQFGPADKWFDVIAVEDLSRGFYLAGEKLLKEDRYFIGSGNPRILRDYLNEIKALVKSETNLEFDVYQDDGLPMQLEWLDSSFFEKETGFKAQMSFAESVENTCNWIKQIEK